MADIFDEVSEDLRQDKIIQVWKKFSKFIISIVVFVIISIVGYQSYTSWEKKQLLAQSELFFNALDNLENKNLNKSTQLFTKILSSNSDGYSMLVSFGLAEANFKNKNINKMIENYKNIYDNINFENYYRDLARILSVIKDNQSPYLRLHDRLKPILNSPSKLQPLAAELEIILLIRFNMIEKARSSLTKLMNRNEITIEQKNRLVLINKLYE